MRSFASPPPSSRVRLVAAALVLALLTPAPSPADPSPGRADDDVAVARQPRRDDRGELVVLHLYGSYYDIGRQQAELLGPIGRRMFDTGLDRYRARLGSADWRMQVQDWLLPLLVWLGPLYEESGFFEEVRGIAAGLGEAPSDVLRVVMSASFGSTVFVATGSATADGKPIIGRNVDWSDAQGVLRPTLLHVHPDNGDLDYILIGWPLITAPAIGINAAGFALSFNFFETEERIGIPPQMRDRRALQTARSVADGLRVFTEVRKRAMPTFMVMADAAGEIAMAECTPSACEVFRPSAPDGDWFAQANHARTPAMIPLDLYRSPDSFRRQAAMEAAVRPHLGRLTPPVAVEILRDRANARFVNDSTVANPYVLNAAVVQPAAGLVWHSTKMQPTAPFGAFAPFSLNRAHAEAATFAASPRLGTAEFAAEEAVVAAAREGLRVFDRGRFDVAARTWGELRNAGGDVLDPDRLAYARALAELRQGRLAPAERILDTIDVERAPFEVAATTLLLRAVLADESGRRGDAIPGYQLALTFLNTRPEYTDTATSTLRGIALAGLEKPLRGVDYSVLPNWLALPH